MLQLLTLGFILPLLVEPFFAAICLACVEYIFFYIRAAFAVALAGLEVTQWLLNMAIVANFIPCVHWYGSGFEACAILLLLL